jgi:lactam utilization protein B
MPTNNVDKKESNVPVAIGSFSKQVGALAAIIIAEKVNLRFYTIHNCFYWSTLGDGPVERAIVLSELLERSKAINR